MDQTYDEQIEQGILTVEKTTLVTADGKQVPAIKTTTILEPSVITVSVEDLQRRLGELQANRVDITNNLDTLDKLIDYHQKAIAAVSNGKH